MAILHNGRQIIKKYHGSKQIWPSPVPWQHILDDMEPSLYDALSFWYDTKVQELTDEQLQAAIDGKVYVKGVIKDLSGKGGDLDIIHANDAEQSAFIDDDGYLGIWNTNCRIQSQKLFTCRDTYTVFSWAGVDLPEVIGTNSQTLRFWVLLNYGYMMGFTGGSSNAYNTMAWGATLTTTPAVTSVFHNGYGGSSNTRPLVCDNNFAWYARFNPNKNRREFFHYNGDSIYQYNASLSTYCTYEVPSVLAILPRADQVSNATRPNYIGHHRWLIGFNRMLDDQEIKWVKEHMYSVPEADIPLPQTLSVLSASPMMMSMDDGAGGDYDDGLS